MLYYAVLCCAVLSSALLYCIVLHCTALHTVLYCTVLYCTVLYFTVLYFTVLYSVLQKPMIPSQRNPRNHNQSMAINHPRCISNAPTLSGVGAIVSFYLLSVKDTKSQTSERAWVDGVHWECWE